MPTLAKSFFRAAVPAILLLCNATDIAAGVLSTRLAAFTSRDASSLMAPQNRAEDSESVSYIPLIIKLNDENAQLPESVVVLYSRGAFRLTYTPADELDNLASLGVIARVEGGEKLTAQMDIARNFTSYPLIEEMKGLPRLFTGKGVVTGFTDIGFDPNHINFRDPLTGMSRVVRLVDYGMSPDEIVRLETPAEIAAYTTDDIDEWHATHVAGILAGNYTPNSYQGIATGSEIVATTSDLYDALLLAGMEDIIAYAREVDKPAVINMSVSSSLGPHDGTSLFCQYLDLLADDAVICISTGNDGAKLGRFTADIPDSGVTGFCLIDHITWSIAEINGYVDIWNSSDSPFTPAVTIHTPDYATVYTAPLPEITADDPEQVFVVATSQEMAERSSMPEDSYIIDPNLARYMSGYSIISTGINPENNRFNALVYSRFSNLPGEDGSPLTDYLSGIHITATPGDHIDAYPADNVRFAVPEAYAANAKATANGAINDLVTGHGVIGVGSLCSRNSWPLIDGTDRTVSDYRPDHVTYTESFWSDAPDGPLPDIVAPGAWLVSSVSTPYTEAHPESVALTTCKVTDNGHDYYWRASSGTSMSSPYVAGVCALWLEADPTLTPAEIKEMILDSAVDPTVEAYDPRWGRGILDSYTPLKTIVDRSSITSLSSPLTTPPVITAIYTLQGQKLPLTPLAPGIYLIRYSDGSVTKTAVTN